MDLRFLVLPQLAAMGMSIGLAAPVVLYLIARWRAHREPVQDPQLGLKFALHYFATIAFHVALVGGTLLIYTMIKPGEEELARFSPGDEWPHPTHDAKSEMYRIAFGFLVPSAIVLAASLGFLVRTNDRHQVGVRKLFLGFNLLITGLVGFSALIFGFQALFAKGSTDGMGHLGGAAILVYCSAWAVLGWRYYQLVLGGSHPFSVEPPDIVAPPPPTASASSSSLPALGGGSYPPIENKR